MQYLSQIYKLRVGLGLYFIFLITLKLISQHELPDNLELNSQSILTKMSEKFKRKFWWLQKSQQKYFLALASKNWLNQKVNGKEHPN